MVDLATGTSPPLRSISLMGNFSPKQKIERLFRYWFVPIQPQDGRKRWVRALLYDEITPKALDWVQEPMKGVWTLRGQQHRATGVP